MNTPNIYGKIAAHCGITKTLSPFSSEPLGASEN